VLGEWSYVATPLDFSRTPVSIRGSAPQPGENNDEVLSAWLGLTPEDIAKLHDNEVI
jgi:crotonobetainyl-CoA:carnitine CoA-transferase CaiB-like acyl-CoA transferase